MNKKFSTLMAGFLLTSAFSSAQISLSVDQLKKVEDDKTIQAGGTFFIIESSDDDLDANDQIFAATLGADGKVQYSSYAFSTYANNQNSTKENLLWNLGVKETTDGLGGTSSYYYTLQNVKTESYLSVDGKSPLEVIKDVVEAPLHGKKQMELLLMFTVILLQHLMMVRIKSHRGLHCILNQRIIHLTDCRRHRAVMISSSMEILLRLKNSSSAYIKPRKPTSSC